MRPFEEHSKPGRIIVTGRKNDCLSIHARARNAIDGLGLVRYVVPGVGDADAIHDAIYYIVLDKPSTPDAVVWPALDSNCPGFAESPVSPVSPSLLTRVSVAGISTAGVHFSVSKSRDTCSSDISLVLHPFVIPILNKGRKRGEGPRSTCECSLHLFPKGRFEKTTSSTVRRTSPY